MDGMWIWVLIALAAVVVLAAVVTFFMVRSRRESERLKSQFDREYDQAVAEHGSQSKAEKELKERVERVEKLSIRPLPADQRATFAREWEAVQAKFVDDPATTVGEADRLVQEVMAAQGYPVGDFERQAADVSVDHPDVVANYRAGHAVYVASQGGRATTDELRSGFVYYRDLFRELLEPAAEDERGASARPERQGEPRRARA